MIDLPRPLAVVAEAAGAANVILSWLEQDPRPVRAFMAGPAADLWRRRFPDRPLVADAEMALDGAAALLTGTGWSEVEHDARRLAQQAGVHSVAVLDHWVNYRARFIRGEETILPDELWVTDEHAAALAASEVPELPAVLKPNTYLEQQAARARGPSTGRQGVLYVLEPFPSGWGRGEPGEFQALDFFVANLAALGIDRDAPIRLRPHPTDPPGKYDEWIARQPRPTSLDNTPELAASIRGAQIVAGCQTFALVIALAAGVKTVSTLPPWAPPCVLPQEGLIHLREIASVR